MNDALESPPNSAYRPRRAHKKSRNGCVKCKERKTKCDEATPRCSRCAKRGLCCQYRTGMSDSTAAMKLRIVSNPQSDDFQQSLQSLVVSSQSYMISNAGRPPSTASPPPSSIPSWLPDLGAAGKLYTNNHPNEILDRTEVDLLIHYLSHTSRIIPYDTEDLYALRIGIPNLAFRSKPLMSSILALAAVCKCHDLAMQPQQDRGKILDLLILADQHHRASLLQVQLDLPNPSQYDYVLANTTLMVLYASATHCVRIRLMETQKKDEPLPREFIPTQSQWISLIRAAHLAFVGLLNDNSKTTEIGYENMGDTPPSTLTSSDGENAHVNEIISPESGPSERTKGLLFPILAASSVSALNALHAKAQAIGEAEGYTASWTQLSDSGNSCSASLQACFASLDILDGIMTDVFSAKDPSAPVTSNPKLPQRGLDSPSIGRLSMVSGWLRSYVARVTSSTTAPRPLRRVIMAFLNRVPAEFLNLVQSTLDSIGVQTAGNSSPQVSWQSSNLEFSNPSAAHKLAIDIFAHWVVLVMLLDGVWWIDGIGAWELGRVVSFVRTQGWLDSPTYIEEHWWPESMYNVGRELRNL